MPEDTADLTREGFSSAVAATIGSVHHLYREIGRLYVALREALQSEPDPFLVLGGHPARPSRDGDRTIVRNFFGQLFEPNLAGEDDGEDDTDDEDDEGEEEGGRRRRRPPAVLDPERPLLVVKLKLFDPQLLAEFEPEVQYAVLGDWACGTSYRKPKGGTQFELAWHMLRRIVKAFDATGQVQGQRTMTKAMIKGTRGVKSADRQISCVILGSAKRVPVFELDSAESLERLGRDIQDHWRETVV